MRKQALELIRQSARVRGIKQKPGLAVHEDGAVAGHVRGDARNPAAHRFEEHFGMALSQ
jgi:hypothetical protein